MTDLPEKIRITNMAWSETKCSYKVQIGDHNETIAYAWVPAGIGDREARERAIAIAEKICAGWNG